jgi:hypothetical protein
MPIDNKYRKSDNSSTQQNNEAAAGNAGTDSQAAQRFGQPQLSKTLFNRQESCVSVYSDSTK